MKPTTLEDLTNLSDQLWKAQERDSLVTQENAALLARVAELEALLTNALPYVQEGEEFNKATRRDLSSDIRAALKA